MKNLLKELRRLPKSEQGAFALKQMAKLDKFLTTDDRVTHIRKTLTSQRKNGREVDPSRSACTLIDMKNGRLIGSGVCPKCHGFMGRAPDYRNDS